MSIVLVCFSNAPKVSDEAVKKDAELDKYLESRVEGKKSVLFTRNAVITFWSLKAPVPVLGQIQAWSQL